jgi:hypothetical protein
VTHLLQIEQPGRLPLFVRRLARDGRMAVTFDPAQACRYPACSPSLLRRAAAAAAAWPSPGRAAFVSAPV